MYPEIQAGQFKLWRRIGKARRRNVASQPSEICETANCTITKSVGSLAKDQGA